jgi:hypothetical protein
MQTITKQAYETTKVVTNAKPLLSYHIDLKNALSLQIPEMILTFFHRIVMQKKFGKLAKTNLKLMKY